MTSRKTGLFTHERTFWHSTGVQALFFPLDTWVEPPSGSYGADTPASKRRILSLAQASGLVEALSVEAGEPATRADLLRIHTADYIDRFKAASDAGGGDLGKLAPFSRGGFEIACITAGLAISAGKAVAEGRLKNAYALCRPGGHHCLPDLPMGFCLLANISIAIEATRAATGLGKVAVIDWDVHHGNGTQAIYYERGDTLTISIHQDRCFPPGYNGLDDRGAGAGFGANINIPLPPGCGHDAYLAAIDTIVLPALERFRPEMIFIASGLDAGAVDPLARMLLHSETYRVMTEKVMAAADELCGGRICVTHEGGYSEAYAPFCGHALLEALSGHRTAVVDPALEMIELWQPVGRTREFQLSMVAEIAARLAETGAA